MRFAVLILLFVSLDSYASHNCVGKVDSVDISADGAVVASIGSLGDGNRICYINKTDGQFTADACKAAFSLIMSAKMTNKNIRLWFNNDANPSCIKGNWGHLAAHGIYHVRVEG